MQGFESVFEEILSAAPQVREEYYINSADGLKYCAKCHTPLEFANGGKKYMQLCACMERKRDEEKRRREEANRIAETEKRRAIAFPNKSFFCKTFADDAYRIKQSHICKKYCERFDEMIANGTGLLLYGTNGTGKSFYSACIVNDLITRGYCCTFTSVPALEAKKRNDFNFCIKDELSRYALAVFDDFGAESTGKYMQQISFEAINARYEANAPMIITTNLKLEEMKNPKTDTEQRLYGRILERCFPVLFNDENLRKIKTKRNYEKTKAILCVDICD